MCWGEFLIVLFVALASVILVGGLIGLFAGVFYEFMSFCFSIGKRIITWPFRTLWRLITPPKKKHYRFRGDDDIEIRF